MAGLVKQKKYDWKDTNMALFGSDLEKKIKKASAEAEKAWEGTGKGVEVRVWRINKFKVESVPKEDYGKFYDGDSYIVLNCYKEEGGDDLKMDVHFWIGKYSTQDEYGTAAYKTVELDNFHDDVPVQHREVMDFESSKFLGYFSNYFILKGGYDSGFRHVGVDNYTPRLIHLQRTSGKKKKVVMREVKASFQQLHEDDSFVYDKGENIYVINGSKCDKDERFAAQKTAQDLKSERGGKPKIEMLDVDECKELLPDIEVHTHEHGYAKKDSKLLKISDASGTLEISEVATGGLEKSMLKTEDVFVVDTNKSINLWVGKGASVDERRLALQTACNYAKTTEHPFSAISCYNEGGEDAHFWKSFA